MTWTKQQNDGAHDGLVGGNRRGRQWARLLAGAGIALKMHEDIAMPFQDIHNLERVGLVAKESDSL
jgi:hypothetical protein